jgi:hypothetical protein
MKKTILLLFILPVLAGMSSAVLLSHVRFGYYPEKIRLAFDFDALPIYETIENKEKITLCLKNTEASAEIQSYVELNDLVVQHIAIEKDGDDLRVSIPLQEPIDCNIFSLNDPPRLIVDFDRDFVHIISGGMVANGIEILQVRQGSINGEIDAYVLKVDLDKAEVRPALARREKTTFIDSFFSLLNPWKGKKASKPFFLDRLSNIVMDNSAAAGINGTFFSNAGNPLGAIMIDQELISSSIHDRTAFFLDEKNRPYIDNVFVAGQVKTAKGASWEITGINQIRGEDDVILYTSAWGEQTQTNRHGIEISAVNAAITAVSPKNSKIPEDGYVLSLNGVATPSASSLTTGDTITLDLRVVPYNTSPNKIMHMLSGGPRLVKNGMLYVSKYEERFRSDIAKGRAARTSIGIDKNGALLLVAVDGPLRGKARKAAGARKSLGATLEELSNLMLRLGAIEAMNLDGGSSTTMVARGEVINNPSNGYERQVSSALVVIPK